MLVMKILSEFMGRIDEISKTLPKEIETIRRNQL